MTGTEPETTTVEPRADGTHPITLRVRHRGQTYKDGAERSINDIRADLRNELDHAIYQTPAGKVLDQRAKSDIVDSVLACLGIPDHGNTTMKREEVGLVGGDNAIVQAARALLQFRPEGGYSPNFGTFAVKDEDSRFYFEERKGKDYQDMVDQPEVHHAVKNGLPTHEEVPRPSDPTQTMRRKIVSSEPMPLLSQPIIYPVLGGKHDGRSFMSRVEALRALVGLDEED